MRTLAEVVEFGRTTGQYQVLWDSNPDVRALTGYRYIRNNHGMILVQIECETERGNRFAIPDSEHERILCQICGADGDA